MDFFKGISVALAMSSAFWGGIYYTYHKGFKDGVESEQPSVESARIALKHGNEKLQQCNQLITRNCQL